MAITQELADQIRQAYENFVTTLNKNGVRYLDTQENCNILRNAIVQQGVGNEALIHPAVWVTGWAQASAAGLLEEPAAPETAEQTAQRERDRIARLEAQDRLPGSRIGNQDKESPYEKASRLKKEIEDKQKAAFEAAKTAAEAAAARKAQENDSSLVPTITEIRNGRLLTRKEMIALSTDQARLYTQRLQRIEREDKVRENEERRKANG